MLHRISKDHDVNRDKWIGIGGHFEEGESPEECLLREVREETGWILKKWRFHGIVTFVLKSAEEPDRLLLTEYMYLYTADLSDVQGASFSRKGSDAEPEPPLPDCEEGVLEWVSISDVMNLNLWKGDKIFFRLIAEDAPHFSLKLTYREGGELLEAVLDGKPVEHNKI